MQQLIKKEATANVTITDYFSGKGCRECNGSGYKGRIGLYEVLKITPEIQKLITQNSSDADIEKLAQTQGMVTLWLDGINKISAGLTTLEEVAQVTNE